MQAPTHACPSKRTGKRIVYRKAYISVCVCVSVCVSFPVSTVWGGILQSRRAPVWVYRRGGPLSCAPHVTCIPSHAHAASGLDPRRIWPSAYVRHILRYWAISPDPVLSRLAHLCRLRVFQGSSCTARSYGAVSRPQSQRYRKAC